MRIYLLEGGSLEFVWTVVPGLLLIFLGIPSLWSLFLVDDLGGEGLGCYFLSVVGHQWYWDYFTSFIEVYTKFAHENGEVDEVASAQFVCSGSSHLLGSDKEFSHHLLEVDGCCFIQQPGLCSCIVTSSDVLHSFAVPSLGIKIDAVPGKGNVVYADIASGVYYGQCSEICGVNHTNMPVILCRYKLDPFKPEVWGWGEGDCGGCKGTGKVRCVVVLEKGRGSK